MAVLSKAEIPLGCFAWGCGFLKDKSLCIDQVSALPLSVLSLDSSRVSELEGQEVCMCSPTGLGVSISGVMSS